MRPAPRVTAARAEPCEERGEHLGHRYSVFIDNVGPIAFTWTAYIDGKRKANSRSPARSFREARAAARATVFEMLEKGFWSTRPASVHRPLGR
jgi:hypothetical protein